MAKLAVLITPPAVDVATEAEHECVLAAACNGHDLYRAQLSGDLQGLGLLAADNGELVAELAFLPHPPGVHLAGGRHHGREGAAACDVARLLIIRERDFDAGVDGFLGRLALVALEAHAQLTMIAAAPRDGFQRRAALGPGHGLGVVPAQTVA